MCRRRATVATLGEWQCKTGGVRRLAVANGPNIFQMLLVVYFRVGRTVGYSCRPMYCQSVHVSAYKLFSTTGPSSG